MAANVLITPCLTGRIAWKAHKSRIGWIRRVHIAPEKSEAGRTIIGPCDPTFALTTWLVGQRPQPTEGEDGDDQERVEQEQRSEEHTSELQSLMRISYAVFFLKKKTKKKNNNNDTNYYQLQR